MGQVLKIEDLIGQQFGKLTIIEEGERHKEPNGKLQRVMLCVCECGEKTKNQLKDLRAGRVKSCGCSHKEHLIDIEKNSTYGNLTIIKELDAYISPRGDKSRKVLCRCICGKEKSYHLHTLRKGEIKDCGCILKIREKKIEIDKLDIDHFNNTHTSNWKVLKEVSVVRDDKMRIKRVVLAKCSCGIEKETNIINIIKTQSCYACTVKKLKEERWGTKTNEERALDKSARSRYSGIRRRCYDENAKDYKRYGARGIKMCEEWRTNPKSFYEWCRDNEIKKGFDIDREDNDGDYSPDNCRVISKAENCRNQSNNVLNWDKVEVIRSLEYSSKELSEMYKCSVNSIESVLQNKTWVK